MRYRIKTHQDFDKEFKRLCKKYSSLKADLSALGKSLSENPDQGTSLGKGVRKVSGRQRKALQFVHHNKGFQIFDIHRVDTLSIL